MNTAPRLSTPQVPQFQLDRDGARVVRWGELDGVVLRPGDRLLLADEGPGPVLLAPRGRGRPMLAERHRSRLLALPARVPVGMVRWRQVGVVRAVQRSLERGAPRGRYHVAVRFQAVRPDADVLGAAAALQGGLLDGGQLDALCLRATLAPRRFGVLVAVAAADSAAAAQDMVLRTDVDQLSFSLPTVPPLGQVLTGPWAPRATPAPAARLPGPVVADRPAAGAPRSPQMLLPFADDTRRSA